VKTLDLNWWRIGLAFVVPTLLGWVVARLFWRRRRADTMMGSVLGGGAIFAAILIFFAGEYIEITRFQIAFAGVPYKVRLGEFNRFVIYAFIGFFDVASVYLLGLSHEERQR